MQGAGCVFDVTCEAGPSHASLSPNFVGSPDFCRRGRSPYVQPELASTDLRVCDEHAGKREEELEAEIVQLDRRITETLR
jgi:hypothetical protein